MVKSMTSYCDRCFAELDSNNECDECDAQRFKKTVKMTAPDYSKMFLPEEEGITWERVPSKYKVLK